MDIPIRYYGEWKSNARRPPAVTFPDGMPATLIKDDMQLPSGKRTTKLFVTTGAVMSEPMKNGLMENLATRISTLLCG